MRCSGRAMDVFWICVLVACLQASVSHAINDPLHENDMCKALPGNHQCLEWMLCYNKTGQSVRIWELPSCGSANGMPKICCPCTETKRANTIAPIISSISPKGCGIRQEPDTGYRIVGGDSVTHHWPWMAALFIDIKGKTIRPLCGGVLIDERHILTAAHCFNFSLNPDHYSVAVGEILMHENLTGLPVEAIKIHESYNKRSLYSDIAIMRLRYPLRDAIPICLPEEISLNVGDTCTALGWGRLSYGGLPSDTLQEIRDLPIASQEKCYKKYMRLVNRTKEFFPYELTNVYICAGSDEGGKGTCKGDSGGPLLYQDPSSKTWYSVGVVSFAYKCAEPGYPSVNTRVSSFTKWIENYVNSYKTYQ